MTLPATQPLPAPAAQLLGWRRLLIALVAAVPLGLLLSLGSTTSARTWILRAVIAAFVMLMAFGIAERRPLRLPRRLPRWLWQLLALAVAAPLGALLAYIVSEGGNPGFIDKPARFVGFMQLTLAGLLFGLWIGLVALVRHRDALARDQAVAFERERAELARQAADARMRLLQAQVQPHFLFNTLANVQALVDAGSPQASAVLRSLVAYLRAAVPRLDESSSTLGQELELVRAYLDVMRMRMPDRLHYALDADADTFELECPPMTLLTLVENAVHHGIDPSEDGGRIDVHAAVHDGRCRVTVEDTGVGLRADAGSLGTGLSTLRERLQFAFGGDAQLGVMSHEPRGVRVELQFPARRRRP